MKNTFDIYSLKKLLCSVTRSSPYCIIVLRFDNGFFSSKSIIRTYECCSKIGTKHKNKFDDHFGIIRKVQSLELDIRFRSYILLTSVSQYLGTVSGCESEGVGSDW